MTRLLAWGYEFQAMDHGKKSIGASSVSGPSTPLRGPQVAQPSRVVGAWLLIAWAVASIGISVALFATAIGNTSRVSRVKNHGIETVASVTLCRGNLGGSGSTLASYTCSGRYVIGGNRYVSVIGGLGTFTQTGTIVPVIADPKDLAVIETVMVAKSGHVGVISYAVPAVLFVTSLGFGAMGIMMRQRRVDQDISEDNR